MSQVFEHKKLGLRIEIPDLKQRDVEAFFDALRKEFGGEIRDLRDLASPARAGAVTRAAAQCGWLKDSPDVGQMPPAAATWVTTRIVGPLVKALTIPPE